MNVKDLLVISELMNMDFAISSFCCIVIKISYIHSIFNAVKYSSFLVDDIANSLFDTPFALFKILLYLCGFFVRIYSNSHKLLKIHSVFRIKGKICAEVIRHWFRRMQTFILVSEELAASQGGHLSMNIFRYLGSSLGSSR